MSDLEKNITDIPIESSNVDLTQASFYIEYGGSFVRIPFSILQDQLPTLIPNDNLIDDTCQSDAKTYSSSFILSKLDERLEKTQLITFDMLDDTAKIELLDYITKNADIGISYELLGQIIDDDEAREDMTYSSSKIEDLMSSQSLTPNSVQGMHLSEDALLYIVNWIKEQGYYFENIPATGFIITNAPIDGGLLMLTPPDVPYTLNVSYTPSSANSGTTLTYDIESSGYSIIDDVIDSCVYDGESTLVTAYLLDDISVYQSFTLDATRIAFEADITGLEGESVPEFISSVSSTGVVLTGGSVYGVSGGIALCNDSTYDTLSLSDVAIGNSNFVLTVKFSDMSSDMVSGSSPGFIRIKFGSGCYFDYQINAVKTFQTRFRLYSSSGTTLTETYGSFMCGSAADGTDVAQSSEVIVTIDLSEGTISTKVTGYSDNAWTTKTSNYNGRTATLNVTDSGYTVEEFFGLNENNVGTATIRINERQLYDCSVSEINAIWE